MQRYVSAVFGIILSVSVCPTVCLSQKRNYIQTTGRIELVLGMESSFPFTSILHCVVRTLKYLRKIKILSSVTLFQTLDLQKFCCEVDGFVNKTLRRSSLLTTPTTVDASQACGWAHEVYYTSVDRNALNPLFRLMVDLLCNLFLQGYSS